METNENAMVAKPPCNKILFVISIIVCLVGIISFWAGFAGNSTPISMIYWGSLIYCIGMFVASMAFRFIRTHFFSEFFGMWVVVGLFITFGSMGAYIIALPFIAPIMLTLFFIFSFWVSRTSALNALSCSAVIFIFILNIILCYVFAFEIEKPLNPQSETLNITADRLEDKNPVFIDDPAIWCEAPVERRHSQIKVLMNKSAAVIGVDIGSFEDANEGKKLNETLFNSYESALNYAREHQYSLIPSVQMVQQKMKAFEDDFMAAVEVYLQDHASVLGQGKRDFLTRLLQKAKENKDSTGAIPYLAAALQLGGLEVSDLSPEQISAMHALEQTFLNSPIHNKPIGFYTKSVALENIFKQDRFLQQSLEPLLRKALADLLEASPDLKTQYTTLLALDEKLTNPSEYCSLVDCPAHIKNPNKISFLPPSSSVENRLFDMLYGGNPSLPNENIMNALIRGIRDGKVNLTPTPESGWYDYQIYALETLLLPERAQEGNKLFLTEAYKKRLIEAFQTILVKNRELHVKRVKIIATLGENFESTPLSICPDLRIEPTATCYLRFTRAQRFVLKSLEPLLGNNALDEIKMPSGESLRTATERMIQLLYGLYLTVCDDIGMLPDFDSDELLLSYIPQAKKTVEDWLTKYPQDESFKQDVRYSVSALTDASHSKVRYWMTLGVKLCKIKATYLKVPHLRMIDDDGEVYAELKGDTSGIKYDEKSKIVCAPQEFYLPVEVFAEATGPATPFTREEFRALCDKYKSKDAIVRAIENRDAYIRLQKPVIYVIIFVVVLLGVFTAINVIRRSRRATVTD